MSYMPIKPDPKAWSKAKAGTPTTANAGDTVFKQNPYEDIKYDYQVQTLNNPQKLMAQNYDLQRQGALGAVGGGVQSGTRTAMTALASSGGLSAADAQALQAQGQRQRVNLSQGALSPYDQMQAQNMYDTDKFNVGQSQATMDYNTQVMNQKARDVATEREKIATNIYQQRMQEALLQRQLEAAKIISQAQLDAPVPKSAIEKILNPLDVKV